VAYGPPTPQPSALARTLPVCRAMRSWHDRAVQTFVTTPPTVRPPPTPSCWVSQTLDYLTPKRRAAGCLSHLEKDPPRRRSL
jgi:hypothetical protein